MNSNRTTGIDFRNRLLAYLRGSGLPATSPLDKKLSEIINTPSAYTDIEGLGPWVIDVRTSAAGDMSTALNEAKDSAKLAGSDWYVSLINRRGYPIEDTYAVLSLEVLTRILSRVTPTHPLLPFGGESK